MGVRWEKEPNLFESVVAAIKTMAWRSELSISEIPAPGKIAPFSVAISADLEVGDEEAGNGQLVLLYNPEGNESWDGEFRCVSYARSDVDPEMASDPLLIDVGWTWLVDALDRNLANYAAPSGTVTSRTSKSFGAISDQPQRSEIELRASWTPLIENPMDITTHLQAWSELLCLTAGLPPLPEGVIPINRRLGSWNR